MELFLKRAVIYLFCYRSLWLLGLWPSLDSTSGAETPSSALEYLWGWPPSRSARIGLHRSTGNDVQTLMVRSRCTEMATAVREENIHICGVTLNFGSNSQVCRWVVLGIVHCAAWLWDSGFFQESATNDARVVGGFFKYADSVVGQEVGQDETSSNVLRRPGVLECEACGCINQQKWVSDCCWLQF